MASVLASGNSKWLAQEKDPSSPESHLNQLQYMEKSHQSLLLHSAAHCPDLVLVQVLVLVVVECQVDHFHRSRMARVAVGVHLRLLPGRVLHLSLVYAAIRHQLAFLGLDMQLAADFLR